MLSHDVDLSDLQPRLIAWLQRRMPQARDLSISDIERVGAGFTNVSIPFTLRWQEAGEQHTAGMLFRSAVTSYPVYPDFKLERQFRIMQCLQGTNVPVPRVYWMEQDEAPLGFPFYIMGKITGVVPSEYPPYHSSGICHDATPELRAKMWWGTLRAMADIHKLDWQQRGLSFLGVPPQGTGPVDQELDYWERYLNWAKEERQPILEASLEWLQKNRYAPARVTLCWGDARLPNTMFSPDGDVLAVLDWDAATLGDPETDLAFMIALDWLLSEGTGVPRLEGFPTTAETIQRYEELTGWRVENFFYNEVFATVRAALTVLRVQKNLLKMGIELPGEDPIVDNFCTQRIASLLNLPMPTASRNAAARSEEVSGIVQLRLTGPGGRDWYVVADKGQTIRHEGQADRPDATITIAAEDWAAIQRGEIKPFNAWTSGKLKVAGNHALYQQLADVIART
jgi:aminoglycoside phosphotransferase (APT) family kinase protein/putative sterol carrier protein